MTYSHLRTDCLYKCTSPTLYPLHHHATSMPVANDKIAIIISKVHILLAWVFVLLTKPKDITRHIFHFDAVDTGGLVSRLVMWNENWIYRYNCATKQQSKQCKHDEFPQCWKSKVQLIASKIRLSFPQHQQCGRN